MEFSILQHSNSERVTEAAKVETEKLFSVTSSSLFGTTRRTFVSKRRVVVTFLPAQVDASFISTPRPPACPGRKLVLLLRPTFA